MTRTILHATLALTMCVVACDQLDDRPGVTTTTSATMETEPIDRSYVAQPPPLVPELDQPEIQDEGRGRLELARERASADRGTMAQ